MPKKFPARVHVILAREAKTAVVIRRGPSKSVCILGWDRRKDEFRIGQWLRGRIYERRCDLSPDGKHFIYFAMNGKWDGPVKGSWTAISRAPYLKALALWPSGNCWNGGGLFLSDRGFWRNAYPYHDEVEIVGNLPSRVGEKPEFPFHESYGGECPGVYYIRLQRDGWTLTGNHTASGDDSITVFQKPLPKGWILEKSAHATNDSPVGKSCYFDTHRLIRPEDGTVVDCPQWEWADVDGKRLVWVEKGVLRTAGLRGVGLGPVKDLHDFNGMEFEAIPAPY